jgi:Mce-associated membrane protein
VTDTELTQVEDAPTGVGASEPATEADLTDEPMSVERRAELRAEAERAERRQMEEAGLIGPGLIEPGLGESGLGESGPDEVEDQVVEDDVVAPAPRPRPTGRRKRTGEAVAPSVLTDPKPKHGKSGAAAYSHDDRTDRTDRTDRHGLVLPIALIVLAGLLVALGVWFQSQAGGIRYNQALVDSAGTTEVAGQTREAVEKAFSYNFADISATEEAANELLVGKAQCQYNAIFEPVRKLAPEQKLVVTVKVASTGVTSLDDDRATVLLFVDQVALRTTDNQSSGGTAMMRVGARKVDGRWKVDNMEMFGQTGDQAAETAKC